MSKRLSILARILEEEKLQKLAQEATVEGVDEIDSTTADQMADQIFNQLFDETLQDSLKV